MDVSDEFGYDDEEDARCVGDYMLCEVIGEGSFSEVLKHRNVQPTVLR